jgi:acetolactate synthase regulatory subunit
MSHTLYVRLRRAEGALVRLLGQIGRRGYEVLGLSARLAPERNAFEVEVEFEPFTPLPPGKPRPPEVLPALVAKLFEVERVELRGGPRPGPGPSDNGSVEAPRRPAPRATGEMRWEE